MVLNTESGQGAVLEAFHRVVIQVNVGDLHVIQIQTVRINRETMILRRDLDLISRQIEDRMIAAMMSELEFVCPAAQSQAKDLMAKANAEHRFFSEEIAHIRDGVLEGFRIAGPVRKKNTVWLEVQDVL